MSKKFHWMGANDGARCGARADAEHLCTSHADARIDCARCRDVLSTMTPQYSYFLRLASGNSSVFTLPLPLTVGDLFECEGDSIEPVRGSVRSIGSVEFWEDEDATGPIAARAIVIGPVLN